MQLHEQYRPQKWSDVIGQDKVIARIQRSQRGLAGRAFWVSGQSGTGKTTIARLIAVEVADEMNIEEMDSGDLTAEGQEKLFEDLDDAHPLLSRCTRLDLSRRGLAEVFAHRAKVIAEAEGLDGARSTST